MAGFFADLRTPALLSGRPRMPLASSPEPCPLQKLVLPRVGNLTFQPPFPRVGLPGPKNAPVTGLLLINLGTPDAPTTPAVRRYLREFLSDPRVLDIHPVGRALLLHLVILPFRPAKSAHAYRSIWTDRGSPLLYHSRDLAAGVAARLGADWHVELAMRYGTPSIASALAALHNAGVGRIVVLPLFPQYASSSTGTAVARV